VAWTGSRVAISLATVYNTLHQFTQAGLLRELAVDGSKTYTLYARGTNFSGVNPSGFSLVSGATSGNDTLAGGSGTNVLLGGADYAVGRKLSASTRLGLEFRRRSGERSDTVPYVEFSGKFDHIEQGFVSAGYVYTLEESSDVVRFTDTQVSRFFVNAQHPLSSRIFASGSLTYEPSQLQGRRGFSNLDEDVVRLGVAMAYVAAKNWTAAVTYDYDRVDSDDVSRQQTRHRIGLTGTFAF
jgi:hypothetical protein